MIFLTSAVLTFPSGKPTWNPYKQGILLGDLGDSEFLLDSNKSITFALANELFDVMVCRTQKPERFLLWQAAKPSDKCRWTKSQMALLRKFHGVEQFVPWGGTTCSMGWNIPKGATLPTLSVPLQNRECYICWHKSATFVDTKVVHLQVSCHTCHHNATRNSLTFSVCCKCGIFARKIKNSGIPTTCHPLI